MSPWSAASITTLALLLATKLADCVTTQARVRSAAQETNPLARRWMARHGVGPTIWAVGALVAGIATVSWLPCLWDDDGWYTAGFVALGLPIAAIQGEVARANATGRLGPLARWVARAHRRGGR